MSGNAAISQQELLLIILSLINLTLKKKSEKGKRKTKQTRPEKLLFKTVEHCNCKEQKAHSTQNMLFSQYYGLASVVKGNEHACHWH